MDIALFSIVALKTLIYY